ncbi:MAG: helix-turn-helix domain-containing protein [Candidatus Merdisoma sp.]|jgi:DNA-binding transcriptional MerR regulator
MSRQRSMEAILASEYVTIGELTRLTGVRYSTLKFYTEEGFLPFEQEEEKLTRRYPREKTIERIARIKALREEGKAIPQIHEILGL